MCIYTHGAVPKNIHTVHTLSSICLYIHVQYLGDSLAVTGVWVLGAVVLWSLMAGVTKEPHQRLDVHGWMSLRLNLLLSRLSSA